MLKDSRAIEKEKVIMLHKDKQFLINKEDLMNVKKFIEENFINKRKEANANKALIITFFGFCFIYFVFSWLNLAFDLKNISLFFIMCGFIWFNAWFLQKVINQQYDEKIKLTQDEAKSLNEWIEKGDFIYSNQEQYKDDGQNLINEKEKILLNTYKINMMKNLFKQYQKEKNNINLFCLNKDLKVLEKTVETTKL